jgi:hypothetical protein
MGITKNRFLPCRKKDYGRRNYVASRRPGQNPGRLHYVRHEGVYRAALAQSVALHGIAPNRLCDFWRSIARAQLVYTGLRAISPLGGKESA